jgi:hypothetical protein
MPYLNLDLDYFDHPKVVRLVGQLGRGSDLLPVRLWCYCGKYHAEDGELIGYSPLEIETAIKWWGQAGKAVEILVLMNFLEKTPDGYQVHDWASINGHISALKKRAQDGAAERWRRYREEKAKDAQAMLKHSSSNAPANAPQEEGKVGFLNLPPEDNSALYRPPIRSEESAALGAQAKHNPVPPGSAKEEFWDPLCRIFGLKPATVADESRLWQQCQDFRLKGATVADLEVRAIRYRIRFPSVAFTPKAVLGNWDLLHEDPPPPTKPGERVIRKSKAMT